MCGAPAASEATRCEHCGARLAMVACPSCFGMIFAGAKFCSHCGAKVERGEAAVSATRLCPRCQVGMESVVIGKANLTECPRCEGVWVDAATLQQICADRDEQAAVLGMPSAVQNSDPGGLETSIHYVPCPVCKQLMNRVNFANCSHVIVDVCSRDGTWFDKDELRRIVEFIRGGGLEQSREREIHELEQRQRELRATEVPGAWDTTTGSLGSYNADRHTGISFAASVLKSLIG